MNIRTHATGPDKTLYEADDAMGVFHYHADDRFRVSDGNAFVTMTRPEAETVLALLTEALTKTNEPTGPKMRPLTCADRTPTRGDIIRTNLQISPNMTFNLWNAQSEYIAREDGGPVEIPEETTP